ncbi:hypothetical protein ACJ41O_001442 [Fusarium nematophilum]
MATGNYYHYEPSFAAAIDFAALFGITTALHFYRLLMTRTWFWIPFLIGGVFETFGFGARAVNAAQGLGNMTFATAVVSNIGIILAPVLFAASVYMTLGRTMLMCGKPELSLIRTKWLTKIFVLGDVVSFLVQAYGVTLLASDDEDKYNRGRNIMVVGLWIQIVFFSLFIFTAGLFWVRMKRIAAIDATPWKKHIIVLLSGSALILVRCAFRVIEYMQGPTGSLVSTEIYMYIFDAALMLTTHD